MKKIDYAAAIVYNQKSMLDEKWKYEDFFVVTNLTENQKIDLTVKFQMENKLTVDGKIGPSTLRRLRTELEFRNSNKSLGQLLIKGKLVTVDFRAVPCTPDSSYSLIKEKDYSIDKRDVTPTAVVWHWDAALSAKSARNILANRGYSSHGGIDNDGIFYQFLDLEDHLARHAGPQTPGGPSMNNHTIGIDISNAVYLKYQSYYEPRWGKRPILSVKINNHKYEILGYYQAQLDTAKALALFFNKTFGIPLVHPNSNNTMKDPHLFKGHMAHFHITKNKFDVAGFDFDYITKE